jgi:hypothetical protein
MNTQIRTLFFPLLLALQGCQHQVTLPAQPSRLVRVSGGGLAPTEVVIRWDRATQVTRYEETSAFKGTPITCRGALKLDEKALDEHLNQLKVCQGKVDSVASDGPQDTLLLTYPKTTKFDATIRFDVAAGESRVLLRGALNPAVAGPQQYSCAGFVELDRFLKEKIPCLSL